MSHNTLVFLGLLLSIVATDLHARDPRREAECRRIDEQIRKIEARMRRPYSASQGVRFDERLRELKDKRYRRCR